MSDEFSWRTVGNGNVHISRAGRLAKTLKGKAASSFLLKVEQADADSAQRLMAKVTGQFKFGNERQSKLRGKGR